METTTNFKPYVPASKIMPEFTILSFLMGAFLACLFVMANVYLGLNIGLTIGAGIPSSIIGLGILKYVLKRNESILEANLVQSVAAMGESLAGGLIYVLPALFLLGMKLTFMEAVTCAVLGGLTGVFLVIPFRDYLTIQEHANLIFPESLAAKEILVHTNEGGGGGKIIALGSLIGGVYKFLSEGLGVWKAGAGIKIPFVQNVSTYLGMETMPSLLGVGFIIGRQTSQVMFAGTVMAWFILIPLIKFLGLSILSPVYPGSMLISEMDASQVWNYYIRYIGAGGVAAGGFFGIVRSLPVIYSSLKKIFSGMKGTSSSLRTDHDVSLFVIIAALLVFWVAIYFLPTFGHNFIGSILLVIFVLFLGFVSARIVGIVGATNNPVSGMTIMSLIVLTLVVKSGGNYSQEEAMRYALFLASVACVSIAVSGGTMQSLKTTAFMGGTPQKVELAMYLGGIVCSAAVAVYVMMLLFSPEYIQQKGAPNAPQATLMSFLVKGIVTAQLPWALVFIGFAIGVVAALLGLPVLSFAIGIYLPVTLTSALFFGGLLRYLIDRKNSGMKDIKEREQDGILMASGFVAGDAIMGVVLAIFISLGVHIGMKTTLISSELVSFVLFLFLSFFLYWFVSLRKKN